jgi:maltose O-acetyltransferase
MKTLKRAILFIPYAVYKLFRKWHEEYRYEIFRQTYKIAPSFRFNGWDILLYGDGQIDLGEDSYIGRSSSIQAGVDSFVRIGKRCAISHNVRIYTTTSLSDQDFSCLREIKSGDVIIEDDVWIGANVFINPGITIGHNSIVGANSVVTHDVPNWTIVGGVPARVIRMKRIV